MDFLDIQHKVDSPEKIVAISGKPTENFLFAREVNKIVNSINSLRHLVTLNSDNINSILSQSPKIELGEIDESFVTILNGNASLEMTAPIFVTYTLGGVDFVSVFVGNNDTYGETPGLFLTETDFILIYQSNAPENSPQPKVYRVNLNQSGALAPVAQIQKNTFGLVPVWNYAGTGNFYIQFPENVLTLNKTSVRISPIYGFLQVVEVGVNSITFFTKNTSNTNANNLLFNTSFEIIVEP